MAYPGYGGGGFGGGFGGGYGGGFGGGYGGVGWDEDAELAAALAASLEAGGGRSGGGGGSSHAAAVMGEDDDADLAAALAASLADVPSTPASAPAPPPFSPQAAAASDDVDAFLAAMGGVDAATQAALLNARDAAGDSPLHIAVRQAHPAIRQYLLQQELVDLGAVNHAGDTAFHIAIEALAARRRTRAAAVAPAPPTAESEVGAGAPVGEGAAPPLPSVIDDDAVAVDDDSNERAAVMEFVEAIKARYMTTVAAARRDGGDVGGDDVHSEGDAGDLAGDVAFEEMDVAAGAFVPPLASSPALVALVAAVSARNALGYTPLHAAVAYELVDVALELTRLLGAGLDLAVNTPDGSGRTPLFTACVTGQGVVAEALARHMHTDVNAMDEWGFTPLIAAVSRRDAGLIHTLALLRGAEVAVDHMDAWGDAAVHHAMRIGSAAALQALLQRWPDININVTGGGAGRRQASSRLGIARTIGPRRALLHTPPPPPRLSTATLRLLSSRSHSLRQSSSDARSYPGSGFAASSAETASAVLAWSSVASGGQAPSATLQRAAATSPPLVATVAEEAAAGAGAGAAAAAAAPPSHPRLLPARSSQLVDADEDVASRTPLSLAVAGPFASHDMLRLLLAAPQVMQTVWDAVDGSVPIVRAYMAGNVTGVAQLLQHPSFVANATTRDDKTLLRVAVAARDVRLAAYLLARGASPNIIGAAGPSPLSAAIANGDVAMVSLLLSHPHLDSLQLDAPFQAPPPTVPLPIVALSMFGPEPAHPYATAAASGSGITGAAADLLAAWWAAAEASTPEPPSRAVVDGNVAVVNGVPVASQPLAVALATGEAALLRPVWLAVWRRVTVVQEERPDAIVGKRANQGVTATTVLATWLAAAIAADNVAVYEWLWAAAATNWAPAAITRRPTLHGDTLISRGIRSGSMEWVRRLLAMEVTVLLCDKSGVPAAMTALELAAASGRGSPAWAIASEVVAHGSWQPHAALLEHQAPTATLSSPAVRPSYRALLKTLQSVTGARGARYPSHITRDSVCRLSLAQLLCLPEHAPAFATLQALHTHISPTAAHPGMLPLLHTAAAIGNYPLVRQLLEATPAGSSARTELLHAASSTGETVLSCAILRERAPSTGVTTQAQAALRGVPHPLQPPPRERNELRRRAVVRVHDAEAMAQAALLGEPLRQVDSGSDDEEDEEGGMMRQMRARDMLMRLPGVLPAVVGARGRGAAAAAAGRAGAAHVAPAAARLPPRLGAAGAGAGGAGLGDDLDVDDDVGDPDDIVRAAMMLGHDDALHRMFARLHSSRPPRPQPVSDSTVGPSLAVWLWDSVMNPVDRAAALLCRHPRDPSAAALVTAVTGRVPRLPPADSSTPAAAAATVLLPATAAVPAAAAGGGASDSGEAPFTLLAFDGDVRTQGSDETPSRRASPLLLACMHGHVALLETMLAHGFHPPHPLPRHLLNERASLYDVRTTALAAAVRCARPDVARRLLAVPGVEVDTDPQGSMHFVMAMERSAWPIVADLARAGTDPARFLRRVATAPDGHDFIVHSMPATELLSVLGKVRRVPATGAPSAVEALIVAALISLVSGPVDMTLLQQEEPLAAEDTLCRGWVDAEGYDLVLGLLGLHRALGRAGIVPAADAPPAHHAGAGRALFVSASAVLKAGAGGGGIGGEDDGAMGGGGNDGNLGMADPAQERWKLERKVAVERAALARGTFPPQVMAHAHVPLLDRTTAAHPRHTRATFIWKTALCVQLLCAMVDAPSPAAAAGGDDGMAALPAAASAIAAVAPPIPTMPQWYALLLRGWGVASRHRRWAAVAAWSKARGASSRDNATWP